MMQDDLYYGPPDGDRFCAYSYTVAGQVRVDLRCPNRVDFYVKIPDGRGDDWRKARAACCEHLHMVIWQMQEDYGGGGFYAGDYLLRAFVPEGDDDGPGAAVPERVRDGGCEPEVEVPGA